MADLKSQMVLVAKFGRTHGLFGELRLWNLSDFAQQFQPGEKFYLQGGEVVQIERYDDERQLVKLCGIDGIDAAKRFVNREIFSTRERTRAAFKLAEGEFFYFDVIGLPIYENGELLGVVSDIIEQGPGYLFAVKTAAELLNRRAVQGPLEAKFLQTGSEDAQQCAKNSQQCAENEQSVQSGAQAQSGESGAKQRGKKSKRASDGKAAAQVKTLAKNFYVPYADAYILQIRTGEGGRIDARGAMDILLQS